ncbi:MULTISPECIES: DUF2889 domain-containing protein [unclassified Variovorax]|uniref:DUF2889 domain-containing protein n=1 Tax=unclassified Variovorax TaxID=663243 RepID=UPI001319207A|nr:MULTISPECIES: DUF2889 domain-containing protein [unclassified Variovorax]VTU16582.1 hypothetical protein SRS16CHR_01812 [Variovorax sp. SRS16]VTU24871.1 hypothetical protein E5CHR_01882 [Variovorax sp. PBL-E5]
MPLPAAEPRHALHQRRVELQGYARLDGLYDIEARMVDTKSCAMTLGDLRHVAPGEPIHDMSIRLVVNDRLDLIEVEACIDASPFAICGEATRVLQSLRGLRIGPGWSGAVRERLGGRQGCTHLAELLGPLATVAFQTLWQVRESLPTPVDASGKPRKIDSCHAYASHRDVVRRRWPQYYDGDEAVDAARDDWRG